MSGIIPGFGYDVFISYRKRDNRYDGWVTGFVDKLRKELESTFKEEITIYFDENPGDGLLDNHIVGKSLESKLKCLVFIPVISHTYCDPNSFAWQYELKLFNKLSTEDGIGRDIKLPGGNFASRILPVKIHDLDENDTNRLRDELGGELRAIDFVFRNPGVMKSLGTKPTLSPQAYEAYLQGVRLPHYNRQGLGVPYYNITDKLKSIEQFKKAIQLDSTFSPPYASLGFMMMSEATFMGVDSVNIPETWKTAKKYLEKSVILDPDNGQAHMLYAMSLLWFEWNFKAAGREYQEARKIYPHFSWTDYLLAMGRFDEASTGAKKNKELDPMNGQFWASVIISAFFSGQNPQKLIKEATSNPLVKDDFLLRAQIARAYLYMRKFDKAGLAALQLSRDFPDITSSMLDAIRATAILNTGKKQEADKIIETIKERSSKKAGGSPSYYLAMVYAYMNDKEKTLYWLEKAFSNHDVELYWLKVEPVFKPIRDDPRFLSLAEKIGIPG